MSDSDNYSNDDLREAVSILLYMVDDMSPEGMHWRGQSPDWFVAAAMMACNIKDSQGKRAIEYLRDTRNV